MNYVIDSTMTHKSKQEILHHFQELKYSLHSLKKSLQECSYDLKEIARHQNELAALGFFNEEVENVPL
jgi:hypothetical protein